MNMTSASSNGYFSRAAGLESPKSTATAQQAAAHHEIDAGFGVNKHFFAGLSEILEVEAALDECLSTVNLLVSEDR